jgi:membrane AbrB-like protein
MVAGGASGIVSIAGDLGADDLLVAFMQYLRVLVVVLLTTQVVAVWGGSGGGSPASEDTFATARDWLLTGTIATGATLAARAAKVPAGPLLGPMVVAGALTLTGTSFVVPPVVRELAFALIGLQVGLRFTPETVGLLGRLTGPVLLAIAALLVASFGLAVLLDVTTSATLLDAYLATTPGGLYAVLAVAFGAVLRWEG